MRTELVKLRTTVKAGGNIDNVGRIKELKRSVARILTISNEKTLTEAKKP